MKRQNDHLQAQIDYLIQGQVKDDDNWREALEVASFLLFAPEVASVVIPKSLKTFTWGLCGGKTDPIAHLKSFAGGWL